MSAKASLSSTRAATKDRTVASLLRFKALYLAILLGGLWFWNGFDKDNFNDVDARWPREGGPIFASHFGTWDAAHYLYLSEVGYGKNMPSCAFYPLWPVLVRCFSVVTGGSHLVAGMVLANVFSLIAFGLFLQMVNDRFDRSSAMLSLVFLLAFPGSLFFQFIYSEGLFFLLLMVLWWNLERRRYAIAWGAAFLLPISRAVGLFCLFPIAWHLVTKEPPAWILGGAGRFRRLRRIGGMSQLAEREELPELLMTTTPGRQREEARSEIRGKSNLVPSAATGWAWWLLLAPFLGWTCYLALMWHWTGNPLEGFEAQKHWRVHSISNLWNVPKFVIGWFDVTSWHAFTGSVLDRCVFVLLLYCLPVIWRLDKGLFVWAWVLGVMPAMSGTFTSFTRFASVAFPMFIALGVFLSKPERRLVRWGLLTVFIVLHLVLVWRFVNFRWAG